MSGPNSRLGSTLDPEGTNTGFEPMHLPALPLFDPF